MQMIKKDKIYIQTHKQCDKESTDYKISVYAMFVTAWLFLRDWGVNAIKLSDY